MKTPLILLAAMATFALADEKPVVAVYDLQKPLPESGSAKPSMFSMEFNPERPLTFYDLSHGLLKAAKDPAVKALVLDVDGSELGLAQLQELRGLLLQARDAGKEVWLYSDYYQNKTALLGSAANHFVLMPEAGIDFSGINAESMYFKGLLDKAGLRADVIHIGDFKSFGEEFYRTGPSEFAAKQTAELIDGVFNEIIDGIAAGRGVERGKLLELLNRGSFTATDAKAAGLVDDLQYRTDFNTDLRKRFADANFDREYGLPDLDGSDFNSIFDVFKLMMNAGKTAAEKQDYVAVIALDGGISDESIAPVRDEIIKLLKDGHAKALVLRVDSPGGSALSAEVLWEATDEWKKTGRPFVVSMGGVAASGGYYVSAAADRIFAQPGTITGSIGVVGMKFVADGAMKTLGITTHAVRRGDHAGAMSMTEPFSESDAAVIRRSMLDVYGTFKKRVTDGRGDRLKGDLEPMAGGRVYTGRRALELGLVDELGGLTDAIAWAAEKSGVKDGVSRLRPEPKSPFEGIFSKPEKKKDDELVRMNSGPEGVAAAVHAVVREAELSALPGPARAAVSRAIDRIESISESRIQLIGPDLRLAW